MLAVDAGSGPCSVALVAAGRLLAERARPGERGDIAHLAAMTRAVLDEAGGDARFAATAATVGPGGFTGLRAALALAQGLALAAGVPFIPVTVSEVLAETLPPLGGRALWVATHSRRGHVFLDRRGVLAAVALAALPWPTGPVALAGNAAGLVASRLAARGADVMLTDARVTSARHVAGAAAKRARGELPPLPPHPLYVDPPEARLPQGGLRPPPEIRHEPSEGEGG